jgi:hypothetical protein
MPATFKGQLEPFGTGRTEYVPIDFEGVAEAAKKS